MIEVELTPYSTRQITGVNIKIQEINFNESATFRVELINGKTLIDIQFVEIKGENYSKWNGDDDYILDFIIVQLGFLRKGERKVYREPISEEEYLELEDEITSYKTDNNELKIRLEDELLKGKILKKNMEEILSQNNMLTEKLSVITFEKNNLKFQFESVNTKYDEITRLSDDKKRHYEYLINRIDELNQINEELSVKFEDKSKENIVLQTCMMDLSSKKEEYDINKSLYDELETNYNKLMEENKRTEMMKVQFQNKIIELKNEMEATVTQMENLENEMEQFDIERNENNNTLTSLQTQVQNYIANEQKLNSIIEIMEKSKNKNLENIGNLNRSISELENTMSNQTDYINELESDMNNRESSINQLQDGINSKNAEIEKNKYESSVCILNLQNEILRCKNVLENERTSFQSQVEQYENYIGTQDKMVNEKQECITKMKQNIINFEYNIEQLDEENSEFIHNLEIYENRNIELEDKLDDLLSNSVVSLEGQIEQKTFYINKVLDELNQEKILYNQLVDETEIRLHEREEHIDFQYLLINDLEDTIHVKSNKITELEGLNSMNLVEVKELKDKLNSLLELNKELDNENYLLHGELEASEEKNNRNENEVSNTNKQLMIQIDMKSTTVEKLKIDNELFQKEIENQSLLITELEDTIQNKSNKITELEGMNSLNLIEVKELKDKLNSLLELNKELDNENYLLHGELEASEEKNNRNENEVSNTNKQLMIQIDMKSTTVEKLKIDNELFQEEIDELNNEMNTLSVQNDAFSQTNENLKIDNELFHKENENQSLLISELEETIQNKSNKIAELEGVNSMNLLEVNELKDKLSSLLELNKELDNENYLLQGDLETSEEKNNRNENELGNTNKKLMIQIDTTNTTVENLKIDNELFHKENENQCLLINDLEETIQVKSNKITELEGVNSMNLLEVNELKDKLSSLLELNKELDNENYLLQGEFETSEEKNNRNENELSNTNKKLMIQIDTTNRTVEKLKVDNELSQEEIENQYLLISELEDTIKNKSNKITELEGLNSMNLLEVNELKDKLSSLLELKKELDDKNYLLQGELDESEEDNNRYEIELFHAKKQLIIQNDEFLQTNEKLKIDIEVCKEEIDFQSLLINDLEDIIKVKSNKIIELEGITSMNSVTITEIKDKLNLVLELNKELDDENYLLHGELDTMDEKNSINENELSHIKKQLIIEIDMKNASVEKLKKDNELFQEEIEELNNELSSNLVQNDEFQRINEELKIDIELFKKEIEELNNELKTISVQNVEFQQTNKELEKYNELFQKDIEELNDEIRSISLQNDEFRQTNEELENDNELLYNLNNEFNSELDEADNKNRVLKEQNTRFSDENQTLVNKLEKFKKQIENLM
jgi:chromosome segregation ATPase